MPRLFFHEPLSEKLCAAVADIFPGSLHIRLMGQGGAADAIVWDLARRLGNCTTGDIAQLLRRRHDDIIRFNEQNEATVLELG